MHPAVTAQDMTNVVFLSVNQGLIWIAGQGTEFIPPVTGQYNAIIILLIK